MRPAPSPQGEVRHHQRASRSMTSGTKNRVDIENQYRRLEYAASSGLCGICRGIHDGRSRGRRCRGSLEFLLESAGEFDEPGRQADVFVRWVAMVVARYDLRPRYIGHGGRNFVQAGMQQVGNEFFDSAVRKQCRQGVQPRGVVQIQANSVLFRGSRRRRFLLPTIEQDLEFHDYSAIPVPLVAHYSCRRPAPKRRGSQMREEFSSEERIWAMASPSCLRLVCSRLAK